jgi:hypothetical protein
MVSLVTPASAGWAQSGTDRQACSWAIMTALANKPGDRAEGVRCRSSSGCRNGSFLSWIEHGPCPGGGVVVSKKADESALFGIGWARPVRLPMTMASQSRPACHALQCNATGMSDGSPTRSTGSPASVPKQSPDRSVCVSRIMNSSTYIVRRVIMVGWGSCRSRI